MITHERVATPEILAARGVGLCEVRDQLVYDRVPRFVDRPVDQAFYRGPHRCVRGLGKVLVFASTLDEAAFREHFAAMEVVR